jgi:hypothetical protein
VEYPDKSRTQIKLTEGDPGMFDASLPSNQAGIYRFHVIADGGTFRGLPFTREQILNAAVWHGGDRPVEPPRDTGQEGWCQFLSCLLGEKTLSRELEQRLRKEGINLDGIRQCLRTSCGDHRRKTSGH